MGLSSKQHKKDLMEDRSPVDSSRNTTKKTGSPTKKTKAREVRDLSRNAEADGDTAAGRYEAKRAEKLVHLTEINQLHIEIMKSMVT